MTIEVHTLSYGNRWWLRLCRATLEEWCKRNGHPFTAWAKPPPIYPASKFCVIDMLKQFLAGDKEWFVYVDGDVYVARNTPALPDLSGPGIYMRADKQGPWARSFRKWVRKCMGIRLAPRSWLYRNSGVWMCDRASAAILFSLMVPPFFRGMQEQTQLNFWLLQARNRGVDVAFLPHEWNRFPSEEGEGYFWHLAGRGKYLKWMSLVKRGVITAG